MTAQILLVGDQAQVLKHPSTKIITTYLNGEVLVSTQAPATETDRRAPPPHGLVLGGIDEAAIDRAEFAARTETDDAFLAFVVFAGPVQREWLEALRAHGVEPLRFQPRSAYLCRVTSAGLARLQRLEFVVRVVPVTPGLKLAPPPPEAGAQKVWIVVEATAELPVTLKQLAAIPGVRIEQPASPAGGLARVSAELEGNAQQAVLALPFVRSIEPRLPVIPEDEVAGLIVAGAYDRQGKPSGAYLTWLEEHGLSGRGVTIGIVDNGIDETHEAFAGRITARDDGRAWHGTFVAGHAAGRYLAEQDGDGFIYGLGTAPFAELISQDNTDAAADSCRETVTTAGPSGGLGTIQNNSWGVGTQESMDYRSLEASYDALVRNATPADATARPLTICFSAGNSGSEGLTRPKAAKNVIVTGNSENYRPLVGGSESDNINHVFTGEHGSSYGNCGDGRIRPDLVAPGEWTASANYDSHSGQAEYISPKLTWGGGTSGASPKTAGACALLTQWWRERNAGATPSPALLRALLVNGAEDTGFGGPIPNNRQGWGRLNLANVLSDDTHHTYVDQSAILRHRGEARTWRLRVADADLPVRATLAWTDPPGPLNSGTAEASAIVNSLALSVRFGDRVYHANNFVNGFSTSGELADPERAGWDNLQNVHLAPGQAQSPFTVEIKSLNITTNCLTGLATDPQQDFALVITNGYVDAGVVPTDLFMVVDDTSPGSGSSIDDVVDSDDDDSDSSGSRPSLTRGDQGDDVMQLQILLQRAGFLSGAPDGVFGFGTQADVKSFQRSAGLAADGIVGPVTWSALEQRTGGGTSNGGSPGGGTTGGGSNGGTTGGDPIIVGGPLTSLPLLRFGDTGEPVRQLQMRLQHLGFLSGSIDGIFGNGTLRAVQAFQRSAGLNADGIVGPSTWAALGAEAVVRPVLHAEADRAASHPSSASAAPRRARTLVDTAARALRTAPAHAQLVDSVRAEAGGVPDLPSLSQSLTQLMGHFDDWIGDGRRKASLIMVGSRTRVSRADIRALRRLALHGDLYLVGTDVTALRAIVQALHLKRGLHVRVTQPALLDATVRSVAAEAAGSQELVLRQNTSVGVGGVERLRLTLDLTSDDDRAVVEVLHVGAPTLEVVTPSGERIALDATSAHDSYRVQVTDGLLSLELLRRDGAPWVGTWEVLVEDPAALRALNAVGFAAPGPKLRVLQRAASVQNDAGQATAIISVVGENGVGVSRLSVIPIRTSAGLTAESETRPFEIMAKGRRLDAPGAERTRAELGGPSVAPSLDVIVGLRGATDEPGLADLRIDVEGITAAAERFARTLRFCPTRIAPRSLWRRRCNNLSGNGRREGNAGAVVPTSEMARRDEAFGNDVELIGRPGLTKPIQREPAVFVRKRPVVTHVVVNQVFTLPIWVHPCLPPPSPATPMRAGDTWLWPDAQARTVYYLLATPARVELGVVVEQDEAFRATGGTATLVVGTSPARTPEQTAAWQSVLSSHGIDASAWRFELLRLDRLDAVLELPEGHSDGATRTTVNTLLGTVIFLVRLTPLGAQIWRQALTSNSTLPGVCNLTAWYAGTDAQRLFAAHSQVSSATLASLIAGVGPEALSVLNPQLAVDATLTIDGDSTIEAISVELRALNGTVRTESFGAEGGSVTMRLVSDNPRAERVDWSAKVDFSYAGWPAMRVRGTLSDASGWSDLVVPSSWLRAVSITTILIGADGNALPAGAADPTNRVSGAIDFSAPFLEGAASLHSGFETSSQDSCTVYVPRPLSEPAGELKLTIFALRDGRDAMLVRNLQPDEEWVLIKVYSNARIEVATNRTPGSETAREPGSSAIARALTRLRGRSS